jgi:hypothetical protein
MVLGIVAIPACCCWFAGAPIAVAALVLGVLALGKIRNEPQTYSGGGMAIAGIVCAAVALVLDLLAIFTTYDDALRRYGTGGRW